MDEYFENFLKDLKREENNLRAGLSDPEATERRVLKAKQALHALFKFNFGHALLSQVRDVTCQAKLAHRITRLLPLYEKSNLPHLFHETDLTLVDTIVKTMMSRDHSLLQALSRLDDLLHAENAYDLAAHRLRPDLEPHEQAQLETSAQDIVFYATDFDYSLVDAVALDRVQRANANSSECLVTLNITGVDEAGHSLYVKLKQFLPRLYVRVPENFRQTKADREGWAQDLYDKLQTTILNTRGAAFGNYFSVNEIVCPLVKYELIENGMQMLPYNGTEPEPFVAIYVRHPQLVAKCRDLLQYPSGRAERSFTDKKSGQLRKICALPAWCPTRLLPQSRRFPLKRAFDVFQANVDFTTVFLTSQSVRPCSWFRLSAGTYQFQQQKLRSRRQYEVSADYPGLQPLPEMDHVRPPLVYGCNDIEVQAKESKFPQWKNPEEMVTHVGLILWRDDDHSSECQRFLFCWKYCEQEEVNADYVFWFKSEKNMMLAVNKFCQVQGIDVKVGHNSDSFDYPYLVERAKRLGLKNWGKFGAVRTETLRLREGNNRGINFVNITLTGQIYIDTLKYAQKNKKYNSNSLNSIAFLLFKETKDEIAIGAWAQYMSTVHGRNIASKYNIRDVELTKRVFQRLQVYQSYEFMARMNFTTIQNCVNRGVSFQIFSNLLNRCVVQEHPRLQYLIPTPNKDQALSDAEYEERRTTLKKVYGAIVLNPKRGFYPCKDQKYTGSGIVMLLDYKSLYPSVIMVWNCCFTTALDNETIAYFNLEEGKDFIRIPDFYYDGWHIYKVYNPNNPAYVLPHLRKGILPATEELYAKMRLYKKDSRDAYKQHAKRLEQFNTGTKITEKEQLCVRTLHQAKDGMDRQVIEIQQQLDQEWENRADLANIQESIERVVRLGKQDDFFQESIKIVMNSFYGYTIQPGRQINQVNFTTGTLWVDKAGGFDVVRSIGQTITTMGRFMLMTAKNYCEMNFHRGKGKRYNTDVIAGDTDSIMVHIEGEIQEEEIRGIADEICAGVNEIFSKPAELEAEAHFVNMCVMGKKRYTALKKSYALGVDDRILIKGEDFKKRGMPLFVSRVCKEMVEAICQGTDKMEVQRIYTEALAYLYSDNINYGDFICKTTLSAKVDDYKSKSTLHVVMALKVQESSGQLLGGGDKVTWVFCENAAMDTKTKRKVSEYLADPLEAAQKRLPLARECYRTMLERAIFNGVAVYTGDVRLAYTKTDIAQMLQSTRSSSSPTRIASTDEECRNFMTISQDRPRPLDEFSPDMRKNLATMTPNTEDGGREDVRIKDPNNFKLTKGLLYGGRPPRIESRKRQSNCSLLKLEGFKMQKKATVDEKEVFVALQELQTCYSKCIECKNDTDIFACQATDCGNFWKRDQLLHNYNKKIE